MLSSRYPGRGASAKSYEDRSIVAIFSEKIIGRVAFELFTRVYPCYRNCFERKPLHDREQKKSKGSLESTGASKRLYRCVDDDQRFGVQPEIVQWISDRDVRTSNRPLCPILSARISRRLLLCIETSFLFLFHPLWLLAPKFAKFSPATETPTRCIFYPGNEFLLERATEAARPYLPLPGQF